jgi:prevent-host-death family protein
MNSQPLLIEPGRIDEPQAAEDYAAVLSRVAADHRPVIVRREGADLAAVVPLEHLELLQEMVARQRAEQLAAQIDWERVVKDNPPAQSWFDGDEPKPF